MKLTRFIPYVILIFSIYTIAHGITFKYGEIETPETFEPVTATKMVEWRLCQLTFEGLVEYVLDEETKEKAHELILATKLDSSGDGLTHNLELRRDVKWSDGQTFNARDVMFTVRLLKNENTQLFDPMLAEYLGNVIAPRGAYSVAISLLQTFYNPLALLTFKIIPSNARNEKGERLIPTNFLSRVPGQMPVPFTQSPVGTGPFVYKENKGRNYIFEKNSYYSEREGKIGKPYIDTIQLTAYADAGTMVADLEGARIDLVTELGPLGVERLAGDPGYKIKNYNTRTVYFLAYNMRDNPNEIDNSKRSALREVNFRKAVTHAIDRHSALEIFYRAAGEKVGGQAHVVITGPFPKDSWAYNQDIPEYEYNLLEANRLVTEALGRLGYVRNYSIPADTTRTYWQKDGKPFELTLKYAGKDDISDRVCDYVKDALKEIGIIIKLDKKLESDWYDEVYNLHDFDIVYHHYSVGDTLNIMPLFDSRQQGEGQSNFSGYISPDIEEGLADMRLTVSPQRMKAYAHRVHKLIHDECAFTFLWQLDQYACYRSNITGVKIHPYYFFSNVEDWKNIKKD